MTASPSRPPRVLHVVDDLHRGAVENWLFRMHRHAARRGVPLDWTFYCKDGQPGDLDEAVLAAGARVVHSPARLSDVRSFVRCLRAEIRSGGYDVVHMHHDLTSAVYLVASAGMGVRKRLVHVHNAHEQVPVSPWKQLVLREPFRHVCLRQADAIVGISQHTLDTFLGGRPRKPGRDMVHYCGVDPEPFMDSQASREAFRAVNGLPSDARLLAFSGRLVPEKNPGFFVDVLAEMNRRDATVYGVVIGDGSERATVEARARARGVQDRIRMLGWHDQVADALVCCDWFILPCSEDPMEGLGLSAIEAQLAGLRLLLSLGVPDDALLPGSVYARLPLAAGAAAWATAALAQLDRPVPGPAEAAVALAASPFDLDRALRHLTDLHA